MNKKITLLAVAFCLIISSAVAQVSITNSTPYTQNFDGLPATGTSTANPSPANWLRYAANGTTITAGTGTSGTGGFYSVGAATERAMGMLLSGSTEPMYVGVKFINNTGSSIVSAAVSYKCEQWRRGNTNAGLKDTLLVAYATGTDSVHQGNWTNVPSLIGSSTNSTTTVSSLDGNTVFTNVSGNITGMVIPNGATFWIRFNDYNITPGADDLLAVDDFSVSFTTGIVAACTEPANSVTNVVLTSSGISSVSGSFTGTTPASDGYLVLLSTSATAPVVADAVVYSVNDVVDGATVISNGTSTTFSKSGLTQATMYHVYVYPYNSVSCSGGPNYKTSAVETAAATTAVDVCPEPTAKPTNLMFTTVDNTNIIGKFNKAVPAPTGGYVVVYSTSSNVAYPLDSSVYIAGDSINYASFKSKVAYVGTDSNFSVSGLILGTKYYFAVIPFSACGAFPNYFRTSPLKDDTTTTGGISVCAEPDTITGITVTNTTDNSITFTFTPNSNAPDGYLVVYRKNNSFLVGVDDGTTYTVGQLLTQTSGSFIDSSYVGYIGTNTTITLSGLTLGSTYNIAVFPYNNTACSGGPNYKVQFRNDINKTSATTTGGACVAPNSVPQNLVFSSVTSTSIAGHFKQQTNADGYVIVIAKGFIATLTDNTNYTAGDSIGFSPKTYIIKTTTTNVDTNFVVNGLVPNTQYGVAIYPYKTCTSGKLYKNIIVPDVNKRDTTTLLTTSIRTKNVEAAFSIYPNPTNTGALFVRFDNRLKEDAVIEVIDILGQKLSTQKITLGNDLQLIDVSNFAKGTYILNVVYKGENNVSTFIVQ